MYVLNYLTNFNETKRENKEKPFYKNNALKFYNIYYLRILEFSGTCADFLSRGTFGGFIFRFDTYL